MKLTPDFIRVALKTADAWDEGFKNSIKQQTIYFDPTKPENAHWFEEGDYDVYDEIEPTGSDPDNSEYTDDLRKYRGIDFSVDNMYVANNGKIVVGAPYRKEVTPNDSLGTFQTLTFNLNNGTIVDAQGYTHAVWVGGHPIEDGLNLKELYPNPVDAVNDFYSDIGMMY